MRVFAGFSRFLDDVAAAFVAACDRWVLRMHSPVELGGESYCTVHWGKPRPWPCPAAREAMDRLLWV